MLTEILGMEYDEVHDYLVVAGGTQQLSLFGVPFILPTGGTAAYVAVYEASKMEVRYAKAFGSALNSTCRQLAMSPDRSKFMAMMRLNKNNFLIFETVTGNFIRGLSIDPIPLVKTTYGFGNDVLINDFMQIFANDQYLANPSSP